MSPLAQGSTETFFPPAQRDSSRELARRVDLVRSEPFLQGMMEALPAPIMILNEARQIVAANQFLLRMLDSSAQSLIGKRPGEVLGCTYWREADDGCGATRHCPTCGAAIAVLTSQETQSQEIRECRMNCEQPEGGGAKDLRVSAAPVLVAGQRFTVCTVEDISHEKRLAVLTRVFFHDVLNTAGGIQGYVRMLEDDPQSGRQRQKLRRLEALTEQLIEEIESQRDLTLAESGDLEVTPQPLRIADLLEDLRTLYHRHAAAAEGRIEIRLAEVWGGRVLTDARILSRVLGNMLINALEATEPGGVVTVRGIEQDGRIAISVHNERVMPENVKLQIFHRSFSTKARAGRGLGTYSIKLLGEHYLKGRVEFVSRTGEGTTFTILLPKVLAPWRRAGPPARS